jgi:hypothetical protein
MMLSFGVVTARITRDLPSVKLQKRVYTTNLFSFCLALDFRPAQILTAEGFNKKIIRLF